MNQNITFGPVIGMSTKECARWSVTDYADALRREDGARLAWYRSFTETVQGITGQELTHGGSLLVPGDVAGTVQQRDLTVALASGGGYTVDTQIGGFTAALYSASLLGALPVTRLQSLRANVTLGNETVRGSSGWVAEGGSISDAQSSYGQIALTPKAVAGKVTYSHQLALQMGPTASIFVMSNLASQVAEAFDTGLLHGSGAAGQPTGIANVAGIDTRTGAALAWADMTAMLKVSEGYRRGASIAIVAGVTTAEVARKRERSAGSGFIAEGNTVAGRPMIVSRAASAATMTVMDWAGCWVADWGAIELQVDPFTDFKTGKVSVLARWFVDLAVERPSKVAHASAVS